MSEKIKWVPDKDGVPECEEAKCSHWSDRDGCTHEHGDVNLTDEFGVCRPQMVKILQAANRVLNLETRNDYLDDHRMAVAKAELRRELTP